MDIGKFKASRGRLIAWILIPPVLICSLGLSAYALRLQSEWQLNRTKSLSDALPRLVQTQRQAEKLIQGFQNSDAVVIQSEDELISFLQGAANDTSFIVDSLKVERAVSAENQNMPMLSAIVKGTGTFKGIGDFLNAVTVRQQLLSESKLQIKRAEKGFGDDLFQADVAFELILFNPANAGGGTR